MIAGMKNWLAVFFNCLNCKKIAWKFFMTRKQDITFSGINFEISTYVMSNPDKTLNS